MGAYQDLVGMLRVGRTLEDASEACGLTRDSGKTYLARAKREGLLPRGHGVGRARLGVSGGMRISLTVEATSALFAEAVRRNLDAAKLVEDVIEAVCEDKLWIAVLDEHE